MSQRNGATCKHQVLHKLGKTATEMRGMFMKVYGREVLSRKWFTNGSNAFAMGRKRLRMSHVQSAIDKQNPGNDRESAINADTRSATDAEIDCGGIWALERTRGTPLFAMIWVNGRSAPDLCRTSSQTSRKQNGWKLLETSFPCVTRIHCFWKTSSREMRPRSGGR